jgi:hypothetical protein
LGLAFVTGGTSIPRRASVSRSTMPRNCSRGIGCKLLPWVNWLTEYNASMEAVGHWYGKSLPNSSLSITPAS